MADVSSLSMVSSYNSLAMYRQQQQSVGQQSGLSISQHQHQQHPGQGQQHVGSGADGQQYWYGYPYTAHAHAAHHQASGAQQYLEPTEVLGWPPHPHPHPHAHPHYSHHLQYQHHQTSYQQQQQQQQQAQHSNLSASNNNNSAAGGAASTGFTDWSGDENKNGVGAGEPSPPITVSGSEISSPGTPTTPPANNNNNNNNVATTPVRPSQIRSPYEWMKKQSYHSQPNPACSVAATATTSSVSSVTPHELCSLDVLGKTRTKDKYRVVYTDHQRLELEKEFHYSRYITIRRKAELAANLALSERQVKIWFQNRRAKERKQTKKREELDQKDPKVIEGGLSNGGMAGLAALGGVGGMLGGLTSLSLAGPPPPPLHPHPHPHPHGHPHPHPHPHPHSVLGL